jgi:hypothetical protein
MVSIFTTQHIQILFSIRNANNSVKKDFLLLYIYLPKISVASLDNDGVIKLEFIKVGEMKV